MTKLTINISNPFFVETTASSTTPKKKAPKGAFQNPVGGFFSQKKKVVLGNVKHSGDEKNISLSKARSSGNVYSDVESLSGEDEDVSMSETDGGFFLGSAATTSKAKQVNTGAGFGSSLGFSNFHMNDNEVVLPSRLSIFLEKKWIDPKIIKTSVEVSIKKSFALDISLSAVEDKLTTVKTQLIRKIFSTINGFGGATTLSKFERIIRSTFTSEKSMEMAASLARENKIVVNTNLKKQEVHSDRAVVIKEILMNMPKDMIVAAVAAVAEFGEIKLIRIQLIGMWQKAVSFLIGKNSVRVAKAVGDCDIWASRDWFKALLFTLPVGTTAHNLGTLLEKAERKTCIINCSLETELESAFLTEPIFNGVRLSWARLDLVQCGKYGCFGHLVLECNVSDILSLISSELLKRLSLGTNCLQLARLYAKKNVPISCPTAFVVSSASSSGGSPSSSGLFSGGMPPIIVGLNDYLAVLECSLEIFSDQVSVILKKLSFVELVLLAAPFCAPSLAVSVPLAPVVDSDMALDNVLVLADPLFSDSSESATILSSSGLKVLTSKVSGLEFKMSTLEALFGSILVKLDLLCSGSGLSLVAMCNVHGINTPAKQENVVCWYFDSGNLILIITKTKLSVRIFSLGLNKSFLDARVAIIMANSLACYVTRIEEISGHVVVVHFLFKNKLLVSVVGLYTGASSGTRFGQVSKMNSVIAKAVNSSCFVILGGNFNENRFGRSTSFKFCLGLDLVNLFAGHSLVSTSTWSNSRGVKKTIDFIFVSESLASAVTGHRVGSVSDFFDTDHCVVSVSVGLGGLLDGWLNSLHKQANKDCWKFLIKAVDRTKWSRFRDCASAKLLAVSGEFLDTLARANVDGIWVLLEKVLVDSVNEIFLRHWFSEF
ncbi:hypothetical protein G9A89_003303 [Geosiphon pyriformis]|nr:hypothetical protein G9A89_003303 [Geosiphon pyriformis]